MTSLLAFLLNILPAQVCGTPDLTWAVLVQAATCPVALEHICHAGDMPDPWSFVACCEPGGMCRIGNATDACDGRGERMICRF